MILTQLTSIYRDGLVRDAIEQAAASDDTDRIALTEQRASLAKEISRSERAIERYQDAFESGDLNPALFNKRLTTSKHASMLYDQDQAVAHDLATDKPTATHAAALRAVAEQLDHVIEHGGPEQAKALSRSSSPSYASTAATRSCPPTASAHPWFARRAVQWS